MDKIIGKYKGIEDGPLLIITAGMHGNEPAGVIALETVFKMLEDEPLKNPDFVYKGEIIGLVGNLAAYEQKKRYLQRDINRCWQPDYIENIKLADINSLMYEDLEIRQILDIISTEIQRTKPQKIYHLDLHTTSSIGGIFAITSDEEESIQIAHDLHVPVVLGLLKGINGTTLHYFKEENIGLPTVSIAFEGGQHDAPLSIHRCIAATINFMRTIGVVDAQHVENRHDHILLKYSENLPAIVELSYKYHIDDNALWQMNPGYKSFQTVKKGEVLATYDGHPIVSPQDGLILMPLYQSQGEDGFFIVEERGAI